MKPGTEFRIRPKGQVHRLKYELPQWDPGEVVHVTASCGRRTRLNLITFTFSEDANRCERCKP